MTPSKIWGGGGIPSCAFAAVFLPEGVSVTLLFLRGDCDVVFDFLFGVSFVTVFELTRFLFGAPLSSKQM